MSVDVPPDSYRLQAHHPEPPDADLWGGEIIAFPGRYRHPLPPDAQPTSRDRFLEISPRDGCWILEEWDDGGGCLASFATKREALAAAMQWLDSGDAELRVLNR
jgi:hypothetical protein